MGSSSKIQVQARITSIRNDCRGQKATFCAYRATLPIMSALSEKINAFRTARIALIIDDFSDTRRAILVSPAIDADAQLINRVLTMALSVCFVAVSPQRAQALRLSPMKRVSHRIGGAPASLSMCISVEARENVTTGISTHDRAVTVRILGEREPMARKLVQPGHIFPIEVRSGGVLVRAALPEAAHDLCVLSGYTDAALFLDLLNSQGNCMIREEQAALASREHIPEIFLSELIEYRLTQEPIVSRIAEARLPTQFDEHLTAVSYTSLLDKTEHLAIIHGEPRDASSCLVRVHVEATVSDVFGGSASSSREQLHTALRAITQHEAGVVVYLRRGESSSPRKPEKDNDSDGSAATVTRPAMMRDYGMGAQILRDLGVTRATILSNSVSSLLGLDTFGITVVGTQRLDEQPVRVTP